MYSAVFFLVSIKKAIVETSMYKSLRRALTAHGFPSQWQFQLKVLKILGRAGQKRPPFPFLIVCNRPLVPPCPLLHQPIINVSLLCWMRSRGNNSLPFTSHPFPLCFFYCGGSDNNSCGMSTTSHFAMTFFILFHFMLFTICLFYVLLAYLGFGAP